MALVRKKRVFRKKKRAAAPRISAQQKKHANSIYQKLAKQYPAARCALNYKNPFELLVSTILSAQCTDVRVNMVTPALFKKYPHARVMAKTNLTDIEHLIRTTGFFRNKAKSLKYASEAIVRQHGGKVPDTMDMLTDLPGVARKTANVILGNAYGKNEGVVVDTHVTRLASRMGLSKQKEPNKIELDLMPQFPRAWWTQLSHLLIFHGRQVCTARKPDCDNCVVSQICPMIGVG